MVDISLFYHTFVSAVTSFKDVTGKGKTKKWKKKVKGKDLLFQAPMLFIFKNVAVLDLMKDELKLGFFLFSSLVAPCYLPDHRHREPRLAPAVFRVQRLWVSNT